MPTVWEMHHNCLLQNWDIIKILVLINAHLHQESSEAGSNKSDNENRT